MRTETPFRLAPHKGPAESLDDRGASPYRALARNASRTAYAPAIVGLALLIAPPRAPAQTAARDLADLDLEQLMQEQVALTGSLLKRTASSEVAQPIVYLQADDLVKAGATNAEQIMQQISQNLAVNVSNATIGIGTGASAYANLRSLGSERTLVLVNGKRLANSPYQTIGVDLNSVPTALLKRVEVLADGGSATYGTDAIAGVINFITASEINGLNIAATAIRPEASGGGEAYLASFSGGFGSLESDGWNVYAGGSWRKQMELPNTARNFSSTGFLPERGVNSTDPNGSPANYLQPGVIDELVNPAAPACNPPFSIYGDAARGTLACTYDVRRHLNVQSPQEQWSLSTKGSLRIGGHHIASLEYMRGDNELLSTVSPQGPDGLRMTAANPYYPGQGITPGTAGLDPSQEIRFAWRTLELGRRQSRVDGYTDRTLAQLEGSLGEWDYQVFAMHSSAEVRVRLTQGFPNELRLPDGFSGANGAPFLNPFGAQSAAGLQFLQDLEVIGEAQRSRAELKIYGVQFNHDFFELRGGPAVIAVAGEFKQEDSRFVNNPAVTELIHGTFADVQDISGARNAKSLFFEANLPVLDTLEIGVSARHDSYSDFGATTNPELSVRYEPIKGLTLRGSYGTSFRAPTIYNVFQPRTIASTLNEYNDPVLCPNGAVDAAAGGLAARDCAAVFNTSLGGNPHLDAEDSNVYRVGLVAKPGSRVSFGVDYWNYRVKKTIGSLPEQAIFDDPQYASRMIRCSQVPGSELSLYTSCNFGGGGDPIAYVADELGNLGDTNTSGIDFTASWSGARTPSGAFGIQYRGTYVSRYEYQREPGGAFFNRAGRSFEDSAVLRFIHFLTFSWERGRWLAQLTHRYRSGYEDCNEACGIEPEFANEVNAFSVFDVSATYRWNDKLTIFATLGNIFDTEPPFTNAGSSLSTNWDDRYADGRLRTFLLTAKYQY